MRLTNEQSQLAADNCGLIEKFLREHDLPRDEYYGIAAEGLCNAVVGYSPERGKLSTLAFTSMLNEVRKYMLHARRKQWKETVNIDGVPESGQSAMQYSKGIQTSTESAAIARTAVGWLKEHRPKEYEICRLITMGYTQREIAKMRGTYPVNVWRLKKWGEQNLRRQLQED